MGEDFLRKTERSYRRSLQKSVADRLIEPPLLQPTERNTTTYPCRLLRPEHPIRDDGKLILHRHDDGSIEIIDEHLIIGTVEGEPAQDLNDYLDKKPGCADMLRIEPVHNDGAYLDFTIQDEDPDEA